MNSATVTWERREWKGSKKERESVSVATLTSFSRVSQSELTGGIPPVLPSHMYPPIQLPVAQD